MAIEMKKTSVKMNKPLYLGMSVLDISKTLMYKFWCDSIKPKYRFNSQRIVYKRQKINISLIFITQSYFRVAKDVRLNTTDFFITEIQIKESFNALHKIIHQKLVLTIRLNHINHVGNQVNHILFWLMTLRLHQIIL